jgi:hypothetical protein
MNMHSPISAGSSRREQRKAHWRNAAREAVATWPALQPITDKWVLWDNTTDALLDREKELGEKCQALAQTELADSEVLRDARVAYDQAEKDYGDEVARYHDDFLSAVAEMEAPSTETILAKFRLYMAIASAPAVDDLSIEDAHLALEAIVADLERLSAGPSTNPTHSEFALARQAHEAAYAAYAACDPVIDDENGEPLGNALDEAQWALEEATPNDLTELAYSMRAALQREVQWNFEDADSADYISDLLGRPGFEAITARTYLAVLELAGIDHPVRDASFGRSFDGFAFENNDEREAAYRKHHALRRAVQKAVTGADGARPSRQAMRDAFNFAIRIGATPDVVERAALSKAAVRDREWPSQTDTRSAA